MARLLLCQLFGTNNMFPSCVNDARCPECSSIDRCLGTSLLPLGYLLIPGSIPDWNARCLHARCRMLTFGVQLPDLVRERQLMSQACGAQSQDIFYMCLDLLALAPVPGLSDTLSLCFSFKVCLVTSLQPTGGGKVGLAEVSLVVSVAHVICCCSEDWTLMRVW